MRETKFRIWDKKLQIFSKDLDTIFGLDWNGNLRCLTSFREHDDFFIQQFTGLKDKNNKQIYEGDIVKFDIEGVDHGPEREVGNTGEVWFCEEDGCWAFGKYTNQQYNPPFDWYYTLADRIDRETLEVIGNVFENPELMK